MQRITVTVPDELLAHARADVEAGRATSVSAWVAAAMQVRADAMAALDRDLDEFYRPRGPVTEAEIDDLVGLTGLSAGELRRFIEERIAEASAGAARVA